MLYLDTLIAACDGAELVALKDVPPGIAELACPIMTMSWPVVTTARVLMSTEEAEAFRAKPDSAVPLDDDGFPHIPIPTVRWTIVFFGPEADQPLYFRGGPLCD